jgi:hypothetical protein
MAPSRLHRSPTIAAFGRCPTSASTSGDGTAWLRGTSEGSARVQSWRVSRPMPDSWGGLRLSGFGHFHVSQVIDCQWVFCTRVFAINRIQSSRPVRCLLMPDGGNNGPAWLGISGRSGGQVSSSAAPVRCLADRRNSAATPLLRRTPNGSAKVRTGVRRRPHPVHRPGCCDRMLRTRQRRACASSHLSSHLKKV